MSLPKYKLIYFDLRARGEVIRQLFILAGVEFEDRRVSFEEWPTLKPTTPFGHLPVLEVDEVPLPQTLAIIRFLAKRFGFYGSGDWEAAQIDALADQMNDYFNEQKEFFPVLLGFAPGDKEKLEREVLEPARAKFFPIVERYLAENSTGYLVGSKLSSIDLALADHVHTLAAIVPGVFDSYFSVLAHQERIYSIPALQEWIETRPKNKF